MKRRILLVDDEVAVLLTIKTVLEINGFDVDTAASAREARLRIRHREYEMIITDMRMEADRAGEEVIRAAKEAPYRPAIALLTAFPVEEDELAEMGADKMLVKPMHTRQLLQHLEALLVRHHGHAAAANGARSAAEGDAKKTVRKSAAKKPAAKAAGKGLVLAAAAKRKSAAKQPVKA